MMSSSTYFRRTMGRAASTPTWACYEQIQDGYSDSDSCSEDEDDYNDDSHDPDLSENESPSGNAPPPAPGSNNGDDLDMDMDEESSRNPPNDIDSNKQKDIKGKQRAVDPEPEPVPRRQKKKQQRPYTLRPILTIHKSQGFVWNQVCINFFCPSLKLNNPTRTCSYLPTSKIDVCQLGNITYNSELTNLFRHCIYITSKR